MQGSNQRLLVAHLIQNDGSGGGPVAVAALVTHLQESFDCRVLHGGSGRVTERCEALGIPHIRLPIDRVYKWLWGGVALFLCLRRTRPDVLVLHGQWASAMGAVAARLAGVRRLIYVAHWPAFYTDWDWVRLTRNFLFERIPCRLSCRVVTLSESSRYQYLLRRHAPETKVVTIGNPLDFGRVPAPSARALFRQKLGWKDDVCHVVFAGRLANEKRIDWLLECWALVSRAGRPAHLWVVGDGEMRRQMEALSAALGVTASCTFLGERPDGIQYLAAADLAVMSSLYESFGLSALEAMACGRPVVASAVDGLRDLVTDGREGFLVPPGDRELMAARMIRLMGDPALREEMGRAGRQTAALYAADAIVPRFRDLILQVAAPAGGPTGTPG